MATSVNILQKNTSFKYIFRLSKIPRYEIISTAFVISGFHAGANP
jgi:hypothetical protein